MGRTTLICPIMAVSSNGWFGSVREKLVIDFLVAVVVAVVLGVVLGAEVLLGLALLMCA